MTNGIAIAESLLHLLMHHLRDIQSGNGSHNRQHHAGDGKDQLSFQAQGEHLFHSNKFECEGLVEGLEIGCSVANRVIGDFAFLCVPSWLEPALSGRECVVSMWFYSCLWLCCAVSPWSAVDFPLCP